MKNKILLSIFTMLVFIGVFLITNSVSATEETEVVNVTINGNVYTLPKGGTLATLDLNAIKNVEGKEFFRFYNKELEEEIEETKLIQEDVTLEAHYVEPIYDEKINAVYCNGVPVTIEERTDGVQGAIVKWDKGEMLVNHGVAIFGGAHGHEGEIESSSVVMNGGNIWVIWGGGYHKSYVKTTNVELNGGTVIAGIHGGGAESNYNRCHKPRHKFEEGQDASPVKVDKANIKVTGGKTMIVYSGSEGNGNTKNIDVTVEGGEIDYLVGNGSNGWIDETTINIKAGTIGVVQGVNRGKAKKVNTNITGGTVQTLYVGGETTDKTVTGVIENVNINITGTAKVSNIEIGTTGGKEIVLGEDNIIVDLKYDNGTVENIDTTKFGETITEYVNVTIGDNKYKLEKGKTLKDLDLTEIKNVKNKEFIGFVRKDTQQNILETMEINENIELEAKYKDKVVVPPTPVKLPFTDVKEKDWYYSPIKYVYENKMILGITDTLFKPNDTLTRAMLVTILWRMEGSPKTSIDKFPDIKPTHWWYDAVNWAASNGVVNGYNDGKFKPSLAISRQQLAVILQNYAKFKKKDVSKRLDITKFTDYKKITSYAVDPVSWAIASKVMSGKENGTKVDPQGTATRAQAATMLTNYCTYIGK